MYLPASSWRLGRLRFVHLLTSPLAVKGLSNKSKDSRVSLVNEGGRTISLLLLAEKNLSDVIFPNVLGSTCSSLQSRRNWTRDLKLQNLCGSLISEFLAKSRCFSVWQISPSQRTSGISQSLFPANFSSTKCVSFTVSGITLIELFVRSNACRWLSRSSLVSILFKLIPTPWKVSRVSGNPFSMG